MTKNKLSDLNDHLFMQLERLGDETMDLEQVELETKRAKSIVAVSSQIIAGANIHLKAAEIAGEYGLSLANVVPQIEKKAE